MAGVMNYLERMAIVILIGLGLATLPAMCFAIGLLLCGWNITLIQPK
jgi:hypothetical protein